LQAIANPFQSTVVFLNFIMTEFDKLDNLKVV